MESSFFLSGASQNGPTGHGPKNTVSNRKIYHFNREKLPTSSFRRIQRKSARIGPRWLVRFPKVHRVRQTQGAQSEADPRSTPKKYPQNTFKNYFSSFLGYPPGSADLLVNDPPKTTFSVIFGSLGQHLIPKNCKSNFFSTS